MEATGAVVPALDSAPVVPSYLEEIIWAFELLSSRRTAGFGRNPIPLTDIHGYLQLFGEPALPRDIFVEHILAMDIVYLTVWAERDKQRQQ